MWLRGGTSWWMGQKSGARQFFRGGNLREFCTRALHTCAVSRRKLAYGTLEKKSRRRKSHVERPALSKLMLSFLPSSDITYPQLDVVVAVVVPPESFPIGTVLLSPSYLLWLPSFDAMFRPVFFGKNSFSSSLTGRIGFSIHLDNLSGLLVVCYF